MKRSSFRLPAALVLAAALCVGSSVSALAARSVDDIHAGGPFSQSVVDGVSSDMLSASFWTSRIGNRQILASPEQIKAKNSAVMNTPAACLEDLSLVSETFNGITFRESLANLNITSTYYLNGQPLPESYYTALSENIMAAEAYEEMPLRYAVVTSRTLMKSLPDSAVISDADWDVNWDQFALSAALINEPCLAYLTTGDRKYTYIKTNICSGWVPTKDIAFTADRAEWLGLLEVTDPLVVTGNSVRLSDGTVVSMGTILPSANGGNSVMLPLRDPNGRFSRRIVDVPAGSDVSHGYLPLSSDRVVSQAMKTLGDPYGWGGSLNSRDCSSLAREVYLCFGVQLPRNTTRQAALPTGVIQTGSLNDEEKCRILDSTPAGAILNMPGHEVIYLGKYNGEYYVLNNTSRFALDKKGVLTSYLVRQVVVTGVTSTWRLNAASYLENLNTVILPWK